MAWTISQGACLRATSAGSFSHIGLFLSRDEDIQEAFSSSVGDEGPHIMFVRGRLFTPVVGTEEFVRDFLDSPNGSDISEMLEDQGLDEDARIERISDEINSGTLTEINEILESPEFVSFLADQGYEGVDTGGNLLVFDPQAQIKSATDNSGEFSPAEPSILRQPARGSFDPNTLTTILHQKADYSTFLHEPVISFCPSMPTWHCKRVRWNVSRRT